jgi:hypothetical protein
VGPAAEVSAVPQGGSRTTVVSANDLGAFAIPVTGFVDPKIAEGGSQTFGPSLVAGTNQFVLGIAGSFLLSVDNPLTVANNQKTIALQNGTSEFGNFTVLPSSSYISDVNSSGQVIFRTVDVQGGNGTGNVLISTAQDWNLPNNSGLLPTRLVLSVPNTGALAPAVAIAKNSNAFAFTAGNSIMEGWVGGGAPKIVISIGDTINGKTISNIEIAERNFINDLGQVVFKADFTDGTSAIVEASPHVWSSALNKSPYQRSALLSLQNSGPRHRARYWIWQ